MYIYIHTYVLCVFIYLRKPRSIGRHTYVSYSVFINTYTHTHSFIYIYMRERVRERERVCVYKKERDMFGSRLTGANVA